MGVLVMGMVKQHDKRSGITYVYDSTSDKNHGSTTGTMPELYSILLHNLDEFLARDHQLASPQPPGTVPSSLLSGSLSMALCCILLWISANEIENALFL